MSRAAVTTVLHDGHPRAAGVLLRLALGSMWIAHALLKYWVFTIPGFGQWLAAQGLPAAAAWPVFLAELLGGLAILADFRGRWVSLALTPLLLVAASTHWRNGWVHTSPGGGWEYPVFLAVVSMAHFLSGRREPPQRLA